MHAMHYRWDIPAQLVSPQMHAYENVDSHSPHRTVLSAQMEVSDDTLKRQLQFILRQLAAPSSKKLKE